MKDARMDIKIINIQTKIRDLYCITNEFELMFPGRHFTPDGHLVGSIGEVLVAEIYDLDLLKASEPIYDAISRNGRMVQIKTTQTNSISISDEPDYLIVLKLQTDGSFEEIFNGPGKPAWNAVGKRSKTGQSRISLHKLKQLSLLIAENDKI